MLSVCKKIQNLYYTFEVCISLHLSSSTLYVAIMLFNRYLFDLYVIFLNHPSSSESPSERSFLHILVLRYFLHPNPRPTLSSPNSSEFNIKSVLHCFDLFLVFSDLFRHYYHGPVVNV